MIEKFDGEYFFLSNFYPAPLVYQGISYKNSEAAFQSAKTLDMEERKKFSNMTASEAKKAGRRIKLREDWEKVKYSVMTDVVLCKFEQNPELSIKLIETENEFLVEGNTWGDTTWGVCNGIGENHLGKILMFVRQSILSKQKGVKHAHKGNEQTSG